MIGFIVDGRVPSVSGCIRNGNPWALFSGWGSTTPVAVMRFSWIAEYINRTVDGVRYELYKPWRRYDAVIFLKSMNRESISLQHVLKKKGTWTIFDANVDYFTEATGTFFYDGMAPSKEQQENALQMAGQCNGIIADSRYIEKVVRRFKRHVSTISDNVLDQHIVRGSNWDLKKDKPLELIWCGQAVKLFELLTVKEVLLEWRERIFLKIITNSLDSIQKWYPPYLEEFESLLRQVPHAILPFESIDALMNNYDNGGVFIAPRFLDNSYNLGHTEWKITLPMARGRVVLCSPQPSYCEVAERSANKGIRVCSDSESWLKALTELTSPSFDWVKEQQAACDVVKKYYATSSIAEAHLRFIQLSLA
ncbi:MAG: hypothetical protein VR65_08010 [Desulfobulbaceae bacterium BRH_c16a]|nr:MAG: hypothetical protein VR65_08010 [Desulfobulbaceae bacterium BRH_c16a]